MSYEYDIQGRRTKQTDPDSGVTTLGYDAGDRLTSSTDARDKKRAYLYDPLGRMRAVYDNAVDGTMRAQWVYDTIAKGRLSQSTRFVGGAAYQTKITGYTDMYQPTGVQVVIPASETNLAGTRDEESVAPGVADDRGIRKTRYPDPMSVRSARAASGRESSAWMEPPSARQSCPSLGWHWEPRER